MNCSELAQRIESLHPGEEAREVARLCLLLYNAAADPTQLADERQLDELWRQVAARLEAARDQHAAMTEELESLAQSDLSRMSIDQVWVLIRAIKVQSQVLQLYLGETPAPAV